MLPTALRRPLGTLVAASRRHVVEPVWSRYSGSPLLATWRELETSQFLPERVILDRQAHRLKALLQYVDKHNEFYHGRFEAFGVDPAEIRSKEDLSCIPVLTKREVRAQGTSILSKGFAADRLMQAKTGGSTGVSLQLWAPEEVSEMRNASGRRSRRWAGWKVGEPVAAVWGNVHLPHTLRNRLREWLLSPWIYMDTMSVTEEAVKRFADDWRRVLPTLIFGHAHSIFVLSQMVDSMNVREIRPRSIIASSMTLLPHERTQIERVFGVRVTDLYGCEEVGLIASECERHEGLHLNIEQLVIEVLREDGTPAGPGENGQVVVTDLLNYAMPLIRYRMEDMAEATDRRCSCGRGLPIIGRVSGRLADFLIRTDGSKVAGISLIENSLTKIPGIVQMQIVQESLTSIRLRVVPDSGFHGDWQAELEAYFRGIFPGAEVSVERTADIPPEPNGKYRFSICRVAS